MMPGRGLAWLFTRTPFGASHHLTFEAEQVTRLSKIRASWLKLAAAWLSA